MTSPPSPPAAKPPSLFGGAANDSTLLTQPGGGPDSIRMLSGLEVTFGTTGAAAPRARPPWRLLAGGLGLVAVAAVAVFWLNREPAPEAPAARVAVGTPVAAPVPALAPVPVAVDKESPVAPASSAVPSMNASPASPPTVAVIERVAPPVAVAAATEPAPAPPAAATPAPEAAVPQKAMAAAAPLESPAALAPAAKAAPTVAVASPRPAARPVPTVAHAAARPAAAREPRAAPTPATRVASVGGSMAMPSAAVVPRSPQDSDVDLLAAMVAHLQGFGPTPPSPEVTGVPRVRTIGQMVHTCTKLPGKEGDSCRRRICTGYWGKDQACPMRLAPKRVGAANRAH